MREEKRCLRHGKMATVIFLLAAKTYKRPETKVGPHRPLRSSTKYLTRNPKISVNPPSILQPILAK